MADVPAKMALPALAAERAKTCTLSFTAGYVDTAVFVGLFGLFTAHVTGNFVLIGSELKGTLQRLPSGWLGSAS